MKRLQIIQSNLEPDKNVIWLDKYKNLKLYNGDGWEEIPKKLTSKNVHYKNNALESVIDDLYNKIDNVEKGAEINAKYDFNSIGFTMIENSQVLADTEGNKIPDGEYAKYIGETDNDGNIVSYDIAWTNIDGEFPKLVPLEIGKIYLIRYINVDNFNNLVLIPLAILQVDWNETDINSKRFIKNKPTKLSEFENDKGYVTESSVANTGVYVNVLREYPGTQLYDSSGNVQTLNLTIFKENDIILIPDSFTTSLYCYYKNGSLFSILHPNRLYKINKHYEKDKDGNDVYFAEPFGVEYQKPSVHECEIEETNDSAEPTYTHHILLDLAYEVNLVNITENCKLRFLLDNELIKPNSIDGIKQDRFLYKKFKIVVTNNTEESKSIYFDLNDEDPLNTGISITHKSNVQGRTFTIISNSINILYITIVGLNSLSNSYGEITYFVDYYGNT